MLLARGDFVLGDQWLCHPVAAAILYTFAVTHVFAWLWPVRRASTICQPPTFRAFAVIRGIIVYIAPPATKRPRLRFANRGYDSTR